uniref:Uncharacterized protein n=1 Tax=Cannabis sativa TaxID=3483 RepID=A0A803NWW4_CANSA
MAGNQANGDDNNGSINVGIMNVPLQVMKRHPSTPSTGEWDGQPLLPSTYSLKLSLMLGKHLHRRPLWGQFSHITPTVVFEGIIQLTMAQYTTLQDQTQALQAEINGRVRTRRPPRLPNTCSDNPKVTNTRRQTNRTCRECMTGQEGLDLNQPTQREQVARNSNCEVPQEEDPK